MIKSLPTNLKKSKTRENFDPKTRENFEAGKWESYERQFWKTNPKKFIENFVWNILFNLQRMTNSYFLLVKLGFLKISTEIIFRLRCCLLGKVKQGTSFGGLLKLHSLTIIVIQNTLYHFNPATTVIQEKHIGTTVRGF